MRDDQPSVKRRGLVALVRDHFLASDRRLPGSMYPMPRSRARATPDRCSLTPA